MNHIVKHFKPYFNTPLDPRRTQGMIAYYDATTQQGGGYFADKVGNRHGVFYNSPTWQDGNSINFNGSSNYISTPLLVSGLYQATLIVDLIFDNTTDLNSCEFYMQETSGGSWQFGVTTPGGVFSFVTRRDGSTTRDDLGCSYISRRRVQYVLQYDGLSGVKRVYIDGRLDAVKTDLSHGAGAIAVGDRSWIGHIGDGAYFNGRIFNLKIFNRIVGGGEILNQYEDPYYFYERPKIYGFVSSSSGGSLPTIINNYRQQGVM